MSSRWSIRVGAFASVIAIAVAACGGTDTGSGSATEAAPATAAAIDEPAQAPPAPAGAAFVPLADGGQIDFNALQGQDVVFWFWAPW